MPNFNKTSELGDKPLWLFRRPGVVLGIASSLLVAAACEKSANVEVDPGGCHYVYTVKPADVSLWSIAEKVVGNEHGTNDDVIQAADDAIQNASAIYDNVSPAAIDKAEVGTVLVLPPNKRHIGTPENC